MKIRRDWEREDILSSYDAAPVGKQLNFWFGIYGYDLLNAFTQAKMQDAEIVFPTEVAEYYLKKCSGDIIINYWGER